MTKAPSGRPADEQPGPETPFIVIPHWTNDLGRNTIERPLPNDLPTSARGSAVPPGVFSYLCESIKVIGGTPGVFTPGVPTTVAVTVRNYGKGAGLDLVTLELWWSAPTTEFGNLTLKWPMVQVVDRLGRDALAQRPPLVKKMTFTTPPDAGPHICVVVRATVGDQVLAVDPNTSDSTPVWPSDPTGDRHWAQQNLQRVSADSSGKFHISFSSANATARDLPFLIRANQVSEHAMEMLAREVLATPSKVEGASVALRPLLVRTQRDQPGGVVGAQAEIAVTIRANCRLQMVLEGQLQQPLGAGEFAAFEVSQIEAGEPCEPKQGKKATSDHGTKRTNRMGSIGVVVFGAQ
jgi:hypothetical protein